MTLKDEGDLISGPTHEAEKFVEGHIIKFYQFFCRY